MEEGAIDGGVMTRGKGLRGDVERSAGPDHNEHCVQKQPLSGLRESLYRSYNLFRCFFQPDVLWSCMYTFTPTSPQPSWLNWNQPGSVIIFQEFGNGNERFQIGLDGTVVTGRCKPGTS